MRTLAAAMLMHVDRPQHLRVRQRHAQQRANCDDSLHLRHNSSPSMRLILCSPDKTYQKHDPNAIRTAEQDINPGSHLHRFRLPQHKPVRCQPGWKTLSGHSVNLNYRTPAEYI